MLVSLKRVIQCLGPTNTREYVVAVKFKHRRLATGRGHSIQEAEMNAASAALQSSLGKISLLISYQLFSPYFSTELFPQLSHQKRIIERSLKRQDVPSSSRRRTEGGSHSSDSN